MQQGMMNENDKQVLSKQETREILTPFAFKINEDLFGTPLAKSWKRAVAISVDLILVGLLALTSATFLALLVAVTLFKLGSEKRAKQLGFSAGVKRRFALRVTAVLIGLSTFLVATTDWFDDSGTAEKVENSWVQQAPSWQDPTGISQVVEVGALVYKVSQELGQSTCADRACWLTALEDVPPMMTKYQMSADKQREVLTEIVADLSMSEDDKSWLVEQLSQSSAEVVDLDATTVNNAQEDESESVSIQTTTSEILSQPQKAENKPIEYSLIKHAEAIIDDLGLGFGWAAFYFTVFTALWHGQTPGKRLVGIRVMQLDGRPLSIMDSFGRYGGYGAGLATGLLGFMQIMWDPNRQAIQDKISATVVVDDNANVSRELMRKVHDGEVRTI